MRRWGEEGEEEMRRRHQWMDHLLVHTWKYRTVLCSASHIHEGRIHEGRFIHPCPSPHTRRSGYTGGAQGHPPHNSLAGYIHDCPTIAYALPCARPARWVIELVPEEVLKWDPSIKSTSQRLNRSMIGRVPSLISLSWSSLLVCYAAPTLQQSHHSPRS